MSWKRRTCGHSWHRTPPRCFALCLRRHIVLGDPSAPLSSTIGSLFFFFFSLSPEERGCWGQASCHVGSLRFPGLLLLLLRFVAAASRPPSLLLLLLPPRRVVESRNMGRKDAFSAKTPVDQYRKQIGKQDYKKTRPMLKATRLKAEAKKTAPGIKAL
ncbi:triple QxxK/R motif-containing protein isoform X2 [Sceloporus undulatus]|uniref:triple QxxK/R motif-containing protein isoform X2 n=1 Tax=Sceloporus undulatus TaxID=8520 RepID=UPI001C4C03F1|nr:triple QxxK/R motif-containing protein isoform X2 [Sceloporus undulatus]